MMDGRIRLYDSSQITRTEQVKGVIEADNGVYTDHSTAAHDDDASTFGPVLEVASEDAIYVGDTNPFAQIKVALDTAAAGAGALSVYYWNGTDWTSEVEELSDGTASGSNAFAQDGVISFKPPSDWTAGNGGISDLSSSLYYVKLTIASDPSTPPVFDMLYPIDGQYFDLVFDGGDLSAPEGRGRPEEKPVLHRGRLTSNYHYIMGTDEPITEPQEVSFTVKLDNAINKTALIEALTCGNPGSSGWSSTGVSTKTDTSLVSGDGTAVSTPAFLDSSKKTVCVQIVWSRDGVKIGREYNEVWFDPTQLSLSESEDGVEISATGLIYGSIRTIYHHAYQY